MSIIDKIGKKKAKTLELMNVTRISENILYTDDNRKMIYILVEPINMSVSSPLVIERRVDALKNVIVSSGTIEIIVLNSFQNYDSNKKYFDDLIACEKNLNLQMLDEMDRQFFDNIKMEMATSREFLIVASFSSNDSDESVISEENKIRQYLFENQFTATIAYKENIKKLCAIYYENASYDKLPDFDGEFYIDRKENDNEN